MFFADSNLSVFIIDGSTVVIVDWITAFFISTTRNCHNPLHTRQPKNHAIMDFIAIAGNKPS